MSIWIINYLVAVLAAICLSWMIIPKIRNIAFRKRLYDEQDGRKIHKGLVPRLGGIAFLPSIAFAYCFMAGMSMYWVGDETRAILESNNASVFGAICAVMLMYLVGMADDLVGVRYRNKFILQITGALLMICTGLCVTDMHGFLWINQWPVWIGVLFTILGVVYVVNAINLIDGIDGLASGVTIMALLFYTCVFIAADMFIFCMIAAATIGALLPFFYFNVFGKADRRTKIFMGDCGSLTIGMILAVLTVAVLKAPAQPLDDFGNLFILAIAPIMLPCLDVARVFLHRVRNGRNPFLPDRTHIHHKILALGFKQSRALIIILVCDAAFMLCNMWLSRIIQPTWLFIGDVVVWTLVNLMLTQAIRKREQRLKTSLFE